MAKLKSDDRISEAGTVIGSYQEELREEKSCLRGGTKAGFCQMGANVYG